MDLSPLRAHLTIFVALNSDNISGHRDQSAGVDSERQFGFRGTTPI